MRKGIKCVECGNKFKWNELPSENKIGINGCVCPQCKASINIIFPYRKLAIMLIVLVCYLPLIFFSVTHFSKEITQILGISGVVVFYFISRNFFNGYASTVINNNVPERLKIKQ
jgi:prepilin signal peptidase PulO-like enzyme (type II secretory pathway)